MTPKLDVFIGIACYNVTDFIIPQIANIKHSIENSGLKVGLCYFDDGSLPEKSEIFERVCKENGVAYKRRPHKGFASVCADIAELGEKHAEMTCYIDSDAFISTYFLRDAYQLLRLSREDTGVLQFVSIQINSIDPFRMTNGDRDLFDRDSFGGEYKKPELATQLCTCGIIYRSNIYQEVAGFDRRYKLYFSDSDYVCQLAEKKYRSYRIHHPKIFHIAHISHNSGLNINELREHDRNYFNEKWKTTPEKMQENLLTQFEENK